MRSSVSNAHKKIYVKLTQTRALRDTNFVNLSTNNKSCLRETSQLEKKSLPILRSEM